MSERPDSLIIKPRSFRVTLWLLDDELNPVEEIDEIKGCSCSYSLNQIPYAQIEPAHGVNIVNGEPSKIIGRLNELINKKAPVGICVERQPDPFYATISVTNNTDEDAEKWPEEKVFIFKGYISGYSVNKTGEHISSQIYIQHWLQDLASVSAYSPRAHTSTAVDFAADVCRVYAPNPEGNLEGWNLGDDVYLAETLNNTEEAVDPNGEKVKRKYTIFDCILAELHAVLLTAAEGSADPCAFGRIEEIYLHKQDWAIKRLVSCLQYQDKIRAAIQGCFKAMTQVIHNTTAASWVTATCWDKIMEFAPTFYYAIAPTAGWAYVIPTPGCIPDTHITLTQDEVTNLYYKVPVTPVLGGVVMANSHKESATDYGDVETMCPIIYPPQTAVAEELYKSIGGPIAVTYMPAYLENIVVTNPPAEIAQIEIAYTDKLEARPKMEEARKEKKAEEEQQAELLYDLVKLEYLSQVFAGRYASVTTGFRGDIVPGACVHVHAAPVVKNNENEEDIDLFGTVSYVSLNISADRQAYTQFALTNIRNLNEYKSTIYNPDVVPFYQEVFDGTKATLYCPFK